MRCGYGSPRCKSSLLALRSTSACKTGRNLPLSVIDEECLDLATLDVHSDQRDAKVFPRPPTFRRRPTPVGDGSPPQRSAADTPFARNRDTRVPDRARSGGPEEEISPAPPTVLATPFFVGPLKSPSSAQAEDDSPTLSRRTGQEPSAASRNNDNNSGAAATTVPGECVPTSRPALGPPAGQVVRRTPQTKTGPSSYLGGGKPAIPTGSPPPLQPTRLTPPRSIALRLLCFSCNLLLASPNGHLRGSR